MSVSLAPVRPPTDGPGGSGSIGAAISIWFV